MILRQRSGKVIIKLPSNVALGGAYDEGEASSVAQNVTSFCCSGRYASDVKGNVSYHSSATPWNMPRCEFAIRASF